MNATANLLADTICRTVELGVTITNAAVEDQLTHLFCNPVSTDPQCPTCGNNGKLRDHITRKVTDLPIVGHPTVLHVRIPRFTCANPLCERIIFQQKTPLLAAERAKTTHRCTRWIVQRLTVDKMSISAVAKALDLGWDVVNQLALKTARELVYSTTEHLDGVRVLGVDEHTWKHVSGGGPSMVTVIVDLTPVMDGKGPARLIDMLPGRSAEVLRTWLKARDQRFRDQVDIVSLDGFTGYATAAGDAVPAAIQVMDPFHVVQLAGQKLTECRQQIQTETVGRRGRSGDPLYGVRRVLMSRIPLLTDRSRARLETVFGDSRHDAVQVTWQIYQKFIVAYAHTDRRRGKKIMRQVLESIRSGVPEELSEVATLGRSLWKRRAQVLAYFDTRTSNGPVEAINGRLEHLRGIALGFRNLGNYILRSLIHSGQLQDRINAL